MIRLHPAAVCRTLRRQYGRVNPAEKIEKSPIDRRFVVVYIASGVGAGADSYTWHVGGNGEIAGESGSGGRILYIHNRHFNPRWRMVGSGVF